MRKTKLDRMIMEGSGEGRVREVCLGGWNNMCRDPKLRESVMSLVN